MPSWIKLSKSSKASLNKTPGRKARFQFIGKVRALVRVIAWQQRGEAQSPGGGRRQPGAKAVPAPASLTHSTSPGRDSKRRHTNGKSASTDKNTIRSDSNNAEFWAAICPKFGIINFGGISSCWQTCRYLRGFSGADDIRRQPGKMERFLHI